MKIIICGAGQVGGQIARYLSLEGNDVTVIDSNEDLVRKLTDSLDVRGIAGFASHPDVLERAGASDADMIIAATYSDEVNMVVCQVAHSIFEITHKIARLRAGAYLDAIYADMYRRDHLPVDIVISPEKEVAELISRRMRVAGAFESASFLEEDAQLFGIRIEDDCPIVNTPLRQLTELFSTFRGSVAAIRRNGTLFVPTAEDQIFVDDEVYLFCLVSDIDRTFEIFGKTNHKISRVFIVGGGTVGTNVAKILEADFRVSHVKLIERNREVAEIAADQLMRSTVLYGDGMDIDILREANIESADAFISVTDDDKVNLLASARAKTLGAKVSIALLNDTTLYDLGLPLDIDILVDPRAATVSSILQHLRRGRIHAVYIVGDNEAEVIEAQVIETSSIEGKMIKDIDFPEGSHVGIIRKAGKEAEVARGDTRLDAGDWITVFALKEDVAKIEQLLQVQMNYF